MWKRSIPLFIILVSTTAQALPVSGKTVENFGFGFDLSATLDPCKTAQVEALRPSCWHSSQYRLSCNDCSNCHRFQYCKRALRLAATLAEES